VSNAFNDIFTQIWLRLKVFVRDRMSVTVYLCVLAIFGIVFINLNIHADDASSIPIGILNLDLIDDEPSEYSSRLVEGLSDLRFFSIHEDSYGKLEEMLYDGYINSIYVIERDYQDKVRKGDINELVTVYHNEKSEFINVVSDIVAGEMLYDICLEKGFITYRRYPAGTNGKKRENEYKAYAAMLMESPEINFGFLITYRSNGDLVETPKEVNNATVYRQVILSMSAMVLAFLLFYIFSSNVMEREAGISGRRKITLLGRISVSFADILTALIITGIPVVLFAWMFVRYANILNQDIIYKMIGITLGYCLITGVLFMILGMVMRSVFWYQLIGSMIVVVFGAVGFLSLVEGITMVDMGIMGNIVPNKWYLEEVGKLL